MIYQTIYALAFLCSFTIFQNNNTNPITHSEEDDYLVVMMNNDLIFEALQLEETTTSSSDILILDQPEFGEIFVNPDNTFTFTPISDVCEETDAFSYLVNLPEGIDTVHIKIEILCEPLTILNGFSPDGDGINDTFTILGIQNFPDNSLAVFDANGKEIYYMKGYKNEWDGTLEDGQLTTDNMYYYVFHDGTNYHSGYVKVNMKDS